MAPNMTSAKDVAHALKVAGDDELAELIARWEDDPRAQVRHAVEGARRRLERDGRERARVDSLYARARELGGPGLVLGVDEVGRGSIAGPLTVAAVALPPEPRLLGLDDSKRLSRKRREELDERIRAIALAIGIFHVPPQAIDRLGMARAIRLAMAGAVRRASLAAGREADAVLIDGRPVGIHPSETCVVKGDATVAPIAAASIVAKVRRDAILVRADGVWPGYAFAASKGYASAAHIAAIRERGLTPYHRRTFCTRLVDEPGQERLF